MTYICPRHPCSAYTGGCADPNCPQHGYNWPVAPISFPSPRVVPVYMQLPSIGFTIAVMDRDGNVIIKTDQSASPFDGGAK